MRMCRACARATLCRRAAALTLPRVEISEMVPVIFRLADASASSETRAIELNEFKRFELAISFSVILFASRFFKSIIVSRLAM